MSLVKRKNIVDLTDDWTDDLTGELQVGEWNRFLEALQVFKNPNYPDPRGDTVSPYDEMTRHHAIAMRTLTLTPGETGTSRNVAHRGPAFFPWHRQALRELEIALCAIQELRFPGRELVGFPYYRWNVDVANWRTHSIWNRIGGDGDPNNSYLINTGPFVSWISTILRSNGTFRDRPGIVRKFNQTKSMPVWGNTANTTYDAAPWNESSLTTASFRTYLERRHNTVHNLIGGDMVPPTSPNDPVFWFHHCNVDRAWARWQQVRDLITNPNFPNFQPKGAIFDVSGNPVTLDTPEGLSLILNYGSIYDEFGNPLPQGHHLNSVPKELGSFAAPHKTNGEMLDRVNFDRDADGNVIPDSGFYYVNTGDLIGDPSTPIIP